MEQGKSSFILVENREAIGVLKDKCYYSHDSLPLHPPRRQALLKIGGVSLYSPCLFGKGIVVHAGQTCEQQTLHLLKQNLSETIMVLIIV